MSVILTYDLLCDGDIYVTICYIIRHLTGTKQPGAGSSGACRDRTKEANEQTVLLVMAVMARRRTGPAAARSGSCVDRAADPRR
jgi:hypothetical protein